MIGTAVAVVFASVALTAVSPSIVRLSPRLMVCPGGIPTASQASDSYVAIGSQNEVQVLDAATGNLIGSPITVGTDPVC